MSKIMSQCLQHDLHKRPLFHELRQKCLDEYFALAKESKVDVPSRFKSPPADTTSSSSSAASTVRQPSPAPSPAPSLTPASPGATSPNVRKETKSGTDKKPSKQDLQKGTTRKELPKYAKVAPKPVTFGYGKVA